MKKIVIDQIECIGCGMCTLMCPNIFKLGKNGKAEVIGQAVGIKEEVVEAIDSCPVDAITFQRGVQ